MIRTRTTRASRAMVLALLASAAAASVACADTYAWSGKGDAPTWDDNPFMSPEIGYANWSPLGSHVPGSGDDVIFGTGFVSGNPNLNGSRSVNSLTIDSSSSFSIVGNPGDSLTVLSDSLTRTAASSGTQTFAAPVLLGDGPQSTVDLSLDGTGSVVFSGLNIQSGTSTTKTGTADMIITGATSTINTALNVTSGNFIVDGTTLTLGGPHNLQVLNPGSAIQVNNGGLLSTGSGLVSSGLVSNGAVLSLTGTGSQLQGGFTVGSGSAGTINVSQGAALNDSAITLGQGDGGNGTLNISSGPSVVGVLTLGSGDGSMGTLNISSAATVNFRQLAMAVTGHSAAVVNVSGAHTTLTTTALNMEGSVSTTDNGNLNGMATIDISDGALLSAGQLMMDGDNGTINVNGGTLQVGNPPTGFGISLLAGNAGNTINLQADPAGGHALVLNSLGAFFFGNITGAGSVIVTRAGTAPGVPGTIQAVLEGENTYTGATIIQNGKLLLVAGSSNSSLYDVQAGTKLELGDFAQEVVNLGYGTILSEPGGEVDYNEVALNGGLIRGSGKNIINGSDSVVFNGTTIGADATVSTVAGTGTPTFNQVTVAGNLMLNSPMNLTSSTIAASGIVNVNTGSNVTSALLTSNGTLSIHSGGSVTNTAANLTLGSGSITTLDNGGALTLANSTALDLRGGMLTNNGTITGPVNVYFGSVAKGGGTYSGSLNVFEGGRVSPGNSPGTLTSTASAWNQGGIYHWDIADLSGPAGAAWDLWNAGTTSITPTGSFEIEIQSLGSLPGGGLQGWNPSQPYSWLIATADNGAFSAEALSHLAIVDAGFADTNSLAGGSFSLTDSPDGNNLYITYSAAPEPASLAGIALFASGMLLRRKKRRCA